MSDSQIAEHRKMVAMTGNLSDFHLNNLRNWPYVIFDKKDLSSVDIDYNFTRGSGDGSGEELYAGMVSYNFNFKDKPPYEGDELKLRINQLKSWVKHVFWTDTKVVIKKEGKKWEI